MSSSRVLTLPSPSALARAATIAVISAANVGHHDFAVRPDPLRRGQPHPAGAARQLKHAVARAQRRELEHPLGHGRAASVRKPRLTAGSHGRSKSGRRAAAT